MNSRRDPPPIDRDGWARSVRLAVVSRRLLLLSFDALLITVSFWAAFVLRFGTPAPPMLLANLPLLPWAVGIGLTVLLLTGWYRGLTRYSGSHSLYTLLPRSGLLVALLFAVSALRGAEQPPFRGFWILFFILFTWSAIGCRIVIRDGLRWWLSRRRDRLLPGRTSQEGEPMLVFGSGEAANQLIAELRRSAHGQPLAVLTEDSQLWGRQMQGLPILPPTALPELIDTLGVRRTLLAVPELPRRRRRQLVESLSAVGLEVLSMPSLDQLASGAMVVSDLRPVAIEDLLGRDLTEPDPVLLATPVAGRVVLVTGAGGSIGSELCRHILRLGPASLVLIENNEFALYTLVEELKAKGLRQGGVESTPLLVPVLADVTDQRRMQDLLLRHRVQEVFHAAAYKHVPLVEINVCAAVANNLLGTHSMLEASIACGVERFTLISTDKAVRPTSVMGATKRGCELLVQDAAARISVTGRGSVYSMVRFGNVLGSSGSVVPRFHAQIAAGGPVTVTHPEITRFFMTIPEAVQLVLQAAGLARGGEVFVLDMGDPVRIVDLARQMVLLSGCTIRDAQHPEGDIPLVFTGLRPGEKLYEELLFSEEDSPTRHPLIRKAQEVGLPPARLAALLERIKGALHTWNEQDVRTALMELVEDDQPSRVPRSQTC